MGLGGADVCVVAQTLHEEALSQLNATQSRVAFMQGMIQHKDQLIMRLQSLVDANTRCATPQSQAGRGEGEAATAAAAATATGTGHEANVPGHQGVAPPASDASDASAGSSSRDTATRPADEGLRDGGAEVGTEGAGADVQTEKHQADAGAEARGPATAGGGHVSPPSKAVSTPTPAERLARLQGGDGAEDGVGEVGGPLTPSQKLQMLLDKKSVRRGSTADGGAGSLPPLPPTFSGGGADGGECLPNGAAGVPADAFCSPRKGAKGSPRFTYL